MEFSNKGKYKPIILNLEDGKKVEITGKIDRIDTAQNEDGKYLRIIDYKSSAKNIDLNEVYAGLQIQLLTYLDAVCKQEDLMPAGILYFSLLEQMVKSDKKITEEEIENEIRKNFKMKGLIVADVKIIKLHDKILETGSSKIVPAAITSSGEVNKRWTSGVSKEEFKVLQDDIQKIIKDIAKEIALNPMLKSGQIVVKVSPDYFRPTEVETLLGDASKAHEKLGWKPKVSFNELVKEMMDNDFNAAREECLRKHAGFTINTYIE